MSKAPPLMPVADARARILEAMTTVSIESVTLAQALGRVLDEIDEIAIATLRSITIETLLKSMTWHREREERRAAS